MNITVTKRKISIFIAITLVLFGGIILIDNIQMNNLFNKKISDKFDIKNESLSQILSNAKEVTLQKRFISLKKEYYISVDNVVIGTVTGKLIPIFGDNLIMRDIKGNVVRSEYQIKRIGPTNGNLFNLSFSRLAQVTDETNKKVGYIGEEKLKDFFKLNHRQYFYNQDGEKLANGKQDFFIFCKDYKIYDNNENIDYIIDGNIFSPFSKATIYEKDDSEILKEDVIFYTIIENSIIEAKSKNSSKSSSKKTKKK